MSYQLKDVTSENTYNELLSQAPYSSLMQSWDYGEALKCEGWNIRRFIVEFDNKPIAVFQIVSRRFILNYLRLQYGPVFLSSTFESTHALAVLKLIRNRWKLIKGAVLLIAPFLPYYSELYSQLEHIGFSPTNTMPWESALIDLDLDERTLLSNMKGGWRTKLNKATRSPIKIINTEAESDFQWLLNQYEQFKTAKNFLGTKRILLENLFNQMSPNKRMHILLCEHENQYIAGIITVTHGSSCSYLLSWSSAKGRMYSANNLLLWEAIKAAKQRKEHCFDLGGTLSTPKLKPITYYKMGLNGIPYRLIGEFKSGFL